MTTSSTHKRKGAKHTKRQIAAAIAGLIVIAWLLVKALTAFMWLAYYAEITM